MFCPRLLALFGENQLCFSELLCHFVYISRHSVCYSRINCDCCASKLEVHPPQASLRRGDKIGALAELHF